ncbi:MAG: SHOCT domain-containing protein [Candidatus Omnitrophota bacterium]
MCGRSGIFFSLLAALLIGYLGFNCHAQTRSLQDLQAEIRANVRREMGIDASAPERRTAVAVLDTEKPSSRGKDDKNPGNLDLVKILAAIIITFGLTTLFIKRSGKKKTKQEHSGMSPDRDEEKAPVIEQQRKERSVFLDEDGSRKETAIDIYEKIERLQALKDKGVLSEEEFSGKKKDLLNRI